MDRLRIATRKSALALWQASHVADCLRAAHPGLAVELVPMSTRGDEIVDRPLADIGGKGLFLKELEFAMLDGRADIAAHSLKDVPASLDPPFGLAAILEREDPADTLVSHRWPSLDALPHGARVGSSSLRRQSQLRERRPDLDVVDLRGNVNTRLSKLDRGEFDAIVLACAGLIRLGLTERITERLAVPGWLPGVGQGAIAIEVRAGDAATAGLVSALDHRDTTICVGAERALNLALAGDCTVPVGAFAQLQDDGRLRLWGMVGDPEGGVVLRADAIGSARDPDELGGGVARQLREKGADDILSRPPHRG